MSVRSQLVRHQVALGTVCSLMLAPVAPLVAAPRPAAVKPSPPIDGGWPKSYVTPTGASVTLYQPQVAAWKNQKQLTLYAAVAYTPSGATKPVLGTVTAVAQTKVAVSDRLVDFSVFTITDSNFPTLDKAQMQEIIAEIANAIRLKALDKGLILLTCGVYGNVIRFLAPITIQDNVMNEALDILESSIREVCAA